MFFANGSSLEGNVPWNCNVKRVNWWPSAKIHRWQRRPWNRCRKSVRSCAGRINRTTRRDEIKSQLRSRRQGLNLVRDSHVACLLRNYFPSFATKFEQLPVHAPHSQNDGFRNPKWYRRKKWTQEWGKICPRAMLVECTRQLPPCDTTAKARNKSNSGRVTWYPFRLHISFTLVPISLSLLQIRVNSDLYVCTQQTS